MPEGLWQGVEESAGNGSVGAFFFVQGSLDFARSDLLVSLRTMGLSYFREGVHRMSEFRVITGGRFGLCMIRDMVPSSMHHSFGA